MPGDTHIEWTDKTWNPTTGCTQISSGCANCYAKTLTERFHGKGSFDTLTLHPERLESPLKWRKPSRVFVNSMSDLFHEEVPDGFIAWVWMTMSQAPWHTFQILTKRPERMRDFVSRWNDLSGESTDFKVVRGPHATREAHPSGRGQLFAAYLDELGESSGGEPPPGAAWPTFDWMEGPRWWPIRPLPNVWLGVTVENQHWADERIPILLDTPAAMRFISAEPLLEAVDLWHSLSDRAAWLGHIRSDQHLDWVIVGGESGPKHRPFNPDWARHIVQQCKANGRAVFIKQMGGLRPGNKLEDLPEDLRVREFPV